MTQTKITIGSETITVRISEGFGVVQAFEHDHSGPDEGGADIYPANVTTTSVTADEVKTDKLDLRKGA